MHKPARIRAAFRRALTELIRRTACDLPRDVEQALRQARQAETAGTRAHGVLSTILENVHLARIRHAPMCQDTGTPTFDARVPEGFDVRALQADLHAAVAEATQRGYLRHNTLHSLTGASIDNNLGPATPLFHPTVAPSAFCTVRLMLKGGGCENVGRQYALPGDLPGAGRDLAGVRRCVLDAVWRAQGNGCAPGILGVCIGGDRPTGFAEAKKVLWRKLGTPAPEPELAACEAQWLRESRQLGIGPMGMGGRTTLLDIKLCAVARLPASYFVTVSYMCWACRRRGVRLRPDGEIQRWLT